MAAAQQLQKKQTRKSWVRPEVDALIAMWGEPIVQEDIERKTTQRKKIWDKLSVRLHDLGFENKPASAIKNKINTIKKEYKRIAAVVGPSGAGADILRDFPWYYKVHDILKDRPAMNAPPGSIGESFELEDAEENADQGGNANRLDDSGVVGDESQNTEDDSEDDGEDGRDDDGITGASEDEDEVDDDSGDLDGQGGHDGDGTAAEENENQEAAGPVAAAQQQQPNQRRGEKRQRPSKDDRTVNAFTKKIKEVVSTSDRRFLAAEEQRRQQEEKRREDDNNQMKGFFEVMRMNMEMQQRREERRSDEFKTLMTALLAPPSQPRHVANLQHPAPHSMPSAPHPQRPAPHARALQPGAPLHPRRTNTQPFQQHENNGHYGSTSSSAQPFGNGVPFQYPSPPPQQAGSEPVYRSL